MAEASLTEEWNHTSSLLAMLANCHRDKKKRSQPFSFREFHPYLQTSRETSEAKPKETADIRILKTVFVE